MCEISDEFETISCGDARTDKRAKKLLTDCFTLTGNGLSGSCRGAMEIKAAYRFFDSNIVNSAKILKPHYQHSIERIKEHPIVVFAQDTTDVDMKHMSTVEDLGVTNDAGRPGCCLHPVIAFTPDKLCLGVVDTQFIIRDAEELGKKTHNNSRKIEDKESYRWIEGFQATCKVAAACSDTVCVSVGDRESDIYELLLAGTHPDSKAKLIVRAWHDRKVDIDEINIHKDLVDENQRLKEEIEVVINKNKALARKKRISNLTPDALDVYNDNKKNISNKRDLINKNKSIIKEDIKIQNSFKYQVKKGNIIGQCEFVLPAGRGRKSRPVKQNIRAATVTLSPSAHKRHLPKVTIHVVLLEELDVPPGESPVTWMLITTLPIDSLEAVHLIIKLYLARWGIEIFFKVLKSGCKIEELRFQKANRILTCISMYMIVAWRLMYVTYIGRECPNLPCSLLFDADEWQPVYITITKSMPPETPPSLGDFIKMIATLGGYRGRTSDGPPGIKVMWIGLQAMHRIAEGWRAKEEFKKHLESIEKKPSSIKGAS